MTLKEFTKEYETLRKTNKVQCKQFVNKTYQQLKNSPDALRLSVLYRKAFLHYQDGKFAIATRELEEIIVEGVKFPFFSEYAYALNLLGIINMLQNHTMEARAFYNQAIYYAKKHRMNNLKGMIYSNLAVVETELHHYEAGIEYLLQAIQMNQDKETGHLGSYYYNLARNYIQVGKSKEAQQALDCCMRYSHDGFDEIFFEFIKKGIAELNGEEERIRECVQKIYEYYQSHTIQGINIDSCMTLCNDCYRLKEYDHLQLILIKLQEYYIKNNRKDVELFVNEMFGKLAMDRNEIGKANKYLQRQVDIYKELRKNDESEVEEKIKIRLMVTKLESEIKTKMEENQNLKRESLTDTLTKLENRRALNQMLHSVKKKNAVSCLFIDVDNFKYFNDTYGHDQGDYVLKSISEILMSVCRNNIRAFRYGGDEFVVICQKIEKKDIVSLAENIRQRINRIPVPNHSDKVGATIGVNYQVDSETPMQIITNADEAMRNGKKKKNVVIEF